MKWTRLVDLGDRAIPHGGVFRFPAKWPYEDKVDLMVTYMPEKERRHALVVTTGHKAGLILVRLPDEAEVTNGNALSTEWIIRNWKFWIYPECDVEDVVYRRNYDVGG